MTTIAMETTHRAAATPAADCSLKYTVTYPEQLRITSGGAPSDYHRPPTGGPTTIPTP